MANAFKQEEGFYHQQFGLKFKGETITVPHWFVWCSNLDSSGSTSEMHEEDLKRSF